MDVNAFITLGLTLALSLALTTGCTGSNADRSTRLDPMTGDAVSRSDGALEPDGGVPTLSEGTPEATASPDTDAIGAPRVDDARPTPSDGESASPSDAAMPEPDAGDATQTLGPDWSLPLCDRACDRFVDCAVDVCAGFDWATAAGVASACAAACDETTAEDVLAAVDCRAALDVLAPAIPDFAPTCASNPCVTACGRVAACVVDVCPAIGPDSEAPIARQCLDGCDGADVSWVGTFDTCESLVGVIAENDVGFREACQGGPVAACATRDECVAYSAHLTACVVEQCDGHADPFSVGIEAAVLAYCLGDDCPAADDVRRLGDPALACDAPGLRGLGAGEPFARLCTGTLGVDPEALREACERIIACPGGEGAAPVESCLAGFAFAPDVVTRMDCLDAAADCATMFLCLQ